MIGSGARRRLTGRVTVELPAERAFRLFTPRGEGDWVAGWLPYFPAKVEDDTEPGTVFETRAHERITTWVVVDREWGRFVRYARVVPQHDAGTVTVDVEAVGGRSEVTVTYDLTALTEAGERHLQEFAAGYPAFLGPGRTPSRRRCGGRYDLDEARGVAHSWMISALG